MEDCSVAHPTIEKCCLCSDVVESKRYVAAFANYVLEHVQLLDKAAVEIYRVLMTSGRFIAFIPNPPAPEFMLVKHTPLWFRRMVTGRNAWHTYYAYKNIAVLTKIFESTGFCLVEKRYWPVVGDYLYKIPFLGILGKSYDKMISIMEAETFMGQVCLIFEK
ncbi:MAG: class I SAM-dependent methyltransferase [Desulfobacteraceae bacterium]|nr:class I SAM-dependent methyltransferase [Desulfobacteraceae bacterium]MBC2720812.1 hypothetical protein [Desulfobacteraceae bacterium]